VALPYSSGTTGPPKVLQFFSTSFMTGCPVVVAKLVVPNSGGSSRNGAECLAGGLGPGRPRSSSGLETKFYLAKPPSVSDTQGK
jgi:hypothetical protein